MQVSNTNKVIKNLLLDGYSQFSAKDLFTKQQLDILELTSSVVPKEKIIVGDVGEKNYLEVGRFMTDIKDEYPSLVNTRYANDVLSVLNSRESKSLFYTIIGGDYYVRRCQLNVMSEGSFIGKHTDTDSNEDYIYSIVIQFSDDYEGGEFFIDFRGKEINLKTNKYDLLINRCEIPHGVRKIKSGIRSTLVLFLSKKDLSQKNLYNKQI